MAAPVGAVTSTIFSMSARVHAVVTGRVQAVGFRDFVRREAGAMGLGGWVRNRHDGSVEVVAEGSEEALERFLGSLRRGPPLARVDAVDARREAARGDFDGFSVAASG